MYFTYTKNCEKHPSEWEALLNYIKNEWKSSDAAHLGDLEHHIEAKALYIFTMSRHLIENAESLSENGNWKLVFVEASILLFPMLELIGDARLGNETNTGSWRRLASGIDWLMDPMAFPTRSSGKRDSLCADESRIGSLGKYMQTLPSGPKVRELYHLRNYFIHGLKKGDSSFVIGAIQTCMNYELPYAVIEQAKYGLAVYWKQLKNKEGTDSTKEWITRLSVADIYPFDIMGSGIYEKGLIDPDIIYWLEKLKLTQ